jgi:phosphatidylserine/phosphatidylglycerophosphate/cardiolipin synthase-like enzyme
MPGLRQLPAVATPGGAAAPRPRAASPGTRLIAAALAATAVIAAAQIPGSPATGASPPAPLTVTLPIPLGTMSQDTRAYFSDTDRPDLALIRLVQSARTRLEAAIYDLTDPRIAQALADAPRRRVDTWAVMDASEARRPGSQAPLLQRALGGHFALRTGRGGGRHAIMHHKFLVADDRYVATGSFNWTREAACCNWENLVILDDPGLAASFEQEFRRLWDAH